jgi:hypothetical protein
VNVNKPIDLKHSLGVYENGDPYIFKSTNGQPIPEGEPVILFRGRDRLALPMLRYYLQLCVADGCTPYQKESMETMIARFQKFADDSTTMKQPGITLGK